MQSRTIEHLVGKLKQLPVLNHVFHDLNRAMQDDSLTVDRVASIVERDPALTTNVLKLANSSFYGLSYQVSSTKRAIMVLGLSTIRNLALAASLIDSFKRGPVSVLSLKGLWQHMFGAALCSRLLIGARAPWLQEEAFLCGLIHDIGKLILCMNFPVETREVIKAVQGKVEARVWQRELKVFGFTHAEVGAYMAEKWRLPKRFSRAISSHHHYDRTEHDEAATLDRLLPQTASSSECREKDAVVLAASVCAGNQVAKAAALGASWDAKVSCLQDEVWNNLGVDEDHLKTLSDVARVQFNDAQEAWGEV